MIRAYHFPANGGVNCHLTPQQAMDLPPNEIVWFDIEDPTPGEMELLARRWHFHRLAIEDVEKTQRRCRFERYPSHDFLVLQSLDRSTPDDPLDVRSMGVFLRKGLFVTVRPKGMQAVDRAAEDLREHPLSGNAERLLYHFVDAIVDEFDPLFDEYAVAIDGLAAKAGHDPSNTVVDDVVTLRRDLLHLRRTMQSYQDVLRRLMDREGNSAESSLFLRDVHDHALALSEMAALQIEIGNGALELHHTASNNRLNAVMKYLAIVSTMLLPMTVISGAFGMNFDNIPGAHLEHGFLLAFVGMVAASVGLVAWFRYKKWF